MIVKFTKYHPMFAHEVGDIVELIDKDAKLLIDANYAEKVVEKHSAETVVEKHSAETATAKGDTEKAVLAAKEVETKAKK